MHKVEKKINRKNKIQVSSRVESECSGGAQWVSESAADRAARGFHSRVQGVRAAVHD